MGVEDYNKQQLERLREHKIAFDQEAMWAAMQKKKKRRGALYFFTMALVALAIVFFTYGLYSYCTGEKSSLENENTSINQLSDKSKIENETANNINQTTTFDKEELEESNSLESKVNNLKDVDSKTESNRSNNSIYTSDDQKSGNTYDGNIRAVRKSENSPLNKNQSTSVESDINSPTDQIFQQNNSINKQENILIENIEKNNSNNLIDIETLKIFEFPYLESLRNLIINGDELKLSTPVITEVLKEPKSRFHLGAYGGVGYLFRQSSIENDTSLQTRETLEEISIGLELKYQLSPKFFVRSGVEYWHATERVESSSTSTFSIDNIENLDELPLGLTQADKGIVVTSLYSKVHTIYQSFNVPVVFGYNTNSDNWNLFAEAGILYNFRNNRRRDEAFVNTEVDLYEIGPQNQISLLAGFGMSYSPTNKVELFARSNWRGSQFVTLKDASNSLKYGAIRSQIGVRIGI